MELHHLSSMSYPMTEIILLRTLSGVTAARRIVYLYLVQRRLDTTYRRVVIMPLFYVSAVLQAL